MRSTFGRGGCAAAAGAGCAAGVGAFAAGAGGGGDWPHPAITSIPMSTALVPAQRAPPVPIMSLVLPWLALDAHSIPKKSGGEEVARRANASHASRASVRARRDESESAGVSVARPWVAVGSQN